MEKLAASQKAVYALATAVLGVVSLFTGLPAQLGLSPEIVAAMAMVLGPLVTWLVPNKVLDTATGRLANVFDLVAELQQLREQRQGELRQRVRDTAKVIQSPPYTALALPFVMLLAGCGGGLGLALQQTVAHPELVAAEAAVVETCAADPATRALAVQGLAAAYAAAGVEPAADRAAAIALARCGPTLPAPPPPSRPALP